ncbi:MAG: hypothetical protein WCF75_25475 [Pseudolabrys sp.]
MQSASKQQRVPFLFRSLSRTAERPLHRRAYTHGANGWIMAHVTVSVLGMMIFIVQCQATFEVLACIRIEATHPSHWSGGMMSLQGEFRIIQLSSDPK